MLNSIRTFSLITMFYSLLIITSLFVIRVSSIYHVQSSFKEECNCLCSESALNDVTICQKMSKFEKELSTVKDAIEYRTRYINQINDLKEKLDWQEYVIEKMSKQIESLSKFMPEEQDDLAPVSQPLIMNPEDEMQNDGSVRKPLIKDSGEDLMRNMSDLLAKVEVVENITMGVQEELESERRVRRHIEQDLNDARSSIKLLGDRFSNLSFPTDDRFSHIEEIVVSTLESMNKTLYEDHLQKLYYMVDGVAHKNETRKLVERLDNVESELHLDVNTSTIHKLTDDLRNITDFLSSLNDTVMEKITTDEARFEVIESKTNKIDELENLTSKIEMLSNTSHLLQSGFEDMWDIVKNESKQLRKDLEIQMNQSEKNTLELYYNLTYGLNALKVDVSQAEESVSNINRDVSILAADMALVENKLYDVTVIMDAGFKDADAKIDNITSDLKKTLDIKTREMKKDNKKYEDLIIMDQRKDDRSEFEEDIKNKFNYDISMENEDDFDSIIKLGNKENGKCSLPATNDEHLLMTFDEDTNGKQHLLFACIPIGQYVLSETSNETECVSGEWQGSIPTCKKLFFGNEIKAEMLKDFIPTITIDPDNVDKANGLMAANNLGHLMVYPGMSFKLHCLYPENMWGIPKWNKNGIVYQSNAMTVIITSAAKEDSGVYTCKTPFGKENSVTVTVEAISCLGYDAASLHGLTVFYRPHPEGMVRVLSTQAQFNCDNGKTISATCLANGKWSRMPPTEEECPTQDSGMPWNCPYLDISSKPNLVLHPAKPYKDKVVIFNCTHDTHKTGSPFTRCKSDGNWSHEELPDCLPNSRI